LGGILKTYREYRASGDADWLAQMWPGVKRALDHVWRAHDPEQAGTILGEQPNTYDIAIYGLNTFIGTLYLAALRAAAQMAQRVGQAEAAETCRAIVARGRAALDTQLWNGEYYRHSANGGPTCWAWATCCRSITCTPRSRPFFVTTFGVGSMTTTSSRALS
jgi:uncharacterized protein (DUF608 family)